MFVPVRKAISVEDLKLYDSSLPSNCNGYLWKKRQLEEEFQTSLEKKYLLNDTWKSFSIDSDTANEIWNDSQEQLPNLDIGELVDVRILGKRSIKYIMGKIPNKFYDGDLEATLLRARDKGNSLSFPQILYKARAFSDVIVFKPAPPRER